MKKEYDLSKLKRRARGATSASDAAKVPISLRLDGTLLADLRSEAERVGIPYQTLIGSILHRYLTGELIERKTVQLLDELRTA